MALPRLTIKLFDPKPGKSYAGSGNLTLPLADVHAFAEWLLGQPGEFDDYLRENVVKLLAFEYRNESRSGTAYRTVQLKDPADLPPSADSGRSWSQPPAQQGPQRQTLQQPHRTASPSSPPAWRSEPGDSDFDDEIPF